MPSAPRLSSCQGARLRAALVLGAALAPSVSWAQSAPVTFSVGGDYPYGDSELEYLQEHMDLHNLYSPSDFFVHVGDIKSGSDVCTEQQAINVASAVRTLAVPAFVVVGDNEWTDCVNPTQAWTWYQQHLSDLDAFFCYPWALERQQGRNENWAFVHKGVLFAGINIPNGDGPNPSGRLQDDANWINSQMVAKKSAVRAAVVFGHAGPGGSRDLFFDQFVTSSATFAKPVLYVMGDEHDWAFDNPFVQPNMRRIILNRGSVEQPVQITVTMDAGNPWSILRDPWQGNPQAFDHEPCVDVGPDRTVDVSQALPIAAFVQDDGPISVLWTKDSGPGTVTFGNSRQATTTASFGAPGTYELRCTVDDGPHEAFDELLVTVTGAGSGVFLAISDVSLNEGNSGTVTAVLDVVRSGSGTGTVSVNFATADSTARAGFDYVQTSGTLTFTSTPLTRTISVTVQGDATLEPDEVFLVNLSGATNGAIVTRSRALGTIRNDDGTLPNQPPVAADDSFLVAEDTALDVATPGVLGNDSDPEGRPLTAAMVTPPAHGGVTLFTDGSFRFTPTQNYFGPDTFRYAASDSAGARDTASVAIDVQPLNDPPVAVTDFWETPFGQPLLVTLPGVLVNDTDVDDEWLFASLVTGPSHGLLSLALDGSFSFDPDPGFFGVDSFTYRATDGTAPGGPAVVRLGVGTRVATSLPPSEDTYVTVSGSTLSFGTSSDLKYRGGGSGFRTHVKFDIASAGAIVSARLRFRVVESGTAGVCRVTGNNYAGTSTPWREENLNSFNSPALGATIASFNTPPAGQWLEIDVASTVRGDGIYSFALVGTGGNAVKVSSKEGLYPPQLVVDAYRAETVPDVAADPASLDYGPLTVGSTASQTVSIRNGGLADLHVTAVSLSGANAAEFAIDAGAGAFTLAPSGSHAVVVRFAPASAGAKLATLRIDSDDPDESAFFVALQGTGTPPPVPDIAATPSSWDFGAVNQGSSATATFTVRNDGTADLTVSAVTLAGADAADFAITGGGGAFLLAPGISRNIDVAFTPPSAGTRTAALRFASNDPDENPLDVALVGTGTTPPVGGGDVLFDASATGGALAVTTVTSGPIAAPASGSPSDFYLVAVSTKPHVPVTRVDGLGLAWTLVRDQCGARGQTGISVFRAMGAAPGGAVTATFASAPGAAAIAVTRFTGVNTATPLGATIRGNTLGLDGACSGGVDLASYNLSIATTVAGSRIASCVGLRRRTHEPGSGYTERLDFAWGSTTAAGLAVMDRAAAVPGPLAVNGTFDGTVDWSLVAVEIIPSAGAPPVFSPDVAITPSPHDYGDVVLGASASRTFSVHNAGNADLAVTATSIAGASAAELAIDSGGGGFTLSPGQTRDVTIGFHPISTGAKSAVFRVASNDPDEAVLDVPLAGTGIQAPPSGADIVLESVVSGGSTLSSQVATSTAVPASAGDLYVAAIASKSFVATLGVNGLGLSWTRAVTQCGARGQTGIEIWRAQGTPTGSEPVTATLAGVPDNAVIIVARYSEVASVGTAVSGNTMGPGGPCAGGVDTAAHSLGVATTASDAVVFAAVADRSKLHEPGSGWTEQAELHQGTGGAIAGAAIVDRSVPTPANLTVNGTFSGTTDWAVAAIELRPTPPLAALAGGREGVADEAGSRPDAAAPVPSVGLALSARPNPFRDGVTIEYSLPAAVAVEVAVYDVTGRRTRNLLNGVEPAGFRQIRWDGRDDARRRVAAGVYFVKLQTGREIRLHRIILAK